MRKLSSWNDKRRAETAVTSDLVVDFFLFRLLLICFIQIDTEREKKCHKRMSASVEAPHPNLWGVADEQEKKRCRIDLFKMRAKAGEQPRNHQFLTSYSLSTQHLH